MIRFFFFLFNGLLLASSFAQDISERSKGNLYFKEDSIDYVLVDTSNVLLEVDAIDINIDGSDKDSTSIKEISHDIPPVIVKPSENAQIYSHADSLVMNLHSISEDTVYSYLDTLNLSPLARAVIEDSLYWMGVAPWFNIFDSMSVNIYEIDGAKYKDTTQIVLYDSIQTDSSRSWSMPLTYSHITSDFGHRRYRWHYGTDLKLVTGDSVLSVFDGVVRICKYNYGGYGNYVLVRHHNGLETLYGHLSKQLVKVGQLVKAGELIGLGGSTGRSSGPHLHFEVRYQGNAIDPNSLFDFASHKIKHRNWDITPKHFKYIRDAKARKYHTIRSGDTLGGIAVRYRTTITRICRLNGISRNTILRIGRRLRVR